MSGTTGGGLGSQPLALHDDVVLDPGDQLREAGDLAEAAGMPGRSAATSPGASPSEPRGRAGRAHLQHCPAAPRSAPDGSRGHATRCLCDRSDRRMPRRRRETPSLPRADPATPGRRRDRSTRGDPGSAPWAVEGDGVRQHRPDRCVDRRARRCRIVEHRRAAGPCRSRRRGSRAAGAYSPSGSASTPEGSPPPGRRGPGRRAAGRASRPARWPR